MEKKYEILENIFIQPEEGVKLYRIRALRDIGMVKKGQLGGFIEREYNLSQDGESWVGGNAWVSMNAQVRDNAIVSGDAIVFGRAKISDNAIVTDNAKVYGNSRVIDNAKVYGNVKIGGNSLIKDNNSYLYMSNGDMDITFSRMSDNSVYMVTEVFEGTIDEVEKELAIINSISPSATKYLAKDLFDNMIYIKMAKSYFDIK